MGRGDSAVSLFVKYFLFFENFLIWLVALLTTGLSAYILILKNKKVTDPIDFFFDPSTLLCTAGAITAFITFFGWLGALREYTCCLRAYNWMLTVVFFGELVLVVLVFVFYFVPDAKQQLGLFPEQYFQDAITKYGVVDDQDMQNFIDNMQESLGCCGFSDSDEGFLDWSNNQYFNCSLADNNQLVSPESCSVPPSCCQLKKGEMKNIMCGRKVMEPSTTGGKPTEATNHNPIFKLGCLKVVGTYINDNALVIGGILLGILLPQMYFMYLSRTLRGQILVQRSKWNRPDPHMVRPPLPAPPQH